MTPSGSSPGTSCPPDRPVRVGTEGLLAAVPVLLGFRPRDSLVLVATGGPGGRRAGLTLRVDLPPPDPDAILDLADLVADALARDRPDGAAVIVVGGDPSGGAAGDAFGVPDGAAAGPVGPELVEDLPPGAAVVVAAALALEKRGIGVHTAAWTAATEAGAPWRCYPFHGCTCSGTLPDPSSTVLAATAAVRGTVVYGSREELERQVRGGGSDGGPGRSARSPGSPVPDDVPGRSAGSSGRAGPEGPRSSPGRGGWPADPRAALERALSAAEANRLDVDARLVRILSAALRDARFRDDALAVCTGPRAPAAEQLWAALARTCPGPAAADPAALLAVCALARGDGALASLALQRALEARPAHRLAAHLMQAVAVGWGPGEFRAWLDGER